MRDSREVHREKESIRDRWKRVMLLSETRGVRGKELLKTGVDNQ